MEKRTRSLNIEVQVKHKSECWPMFESILDLADKLAATGYFIDPVMTQVVYLAAKMRKPLLLLEGPAGSGKTQTEEKPLALAVTSTT